jgi:hypothetical protein
VFIDAVVYPATCSFNALQALLGRCGQTLPQSNTPSNGTNSAAGSILGHLHSHQSHKNLVRYLCSICTCLAIYIGTACCVPIHFHTAALSIYRDASINFEGNAKVWITPSSVHKRQRNSLAPRIMTPVLSSSSPHVGMLCDTSVKIKVQSDHHLLADCCAWRVLWN